MFIQLNSFGEIIYGIISKLLDYISSLWQQVWCGWIQNGIKSFTTVIWAKITLCILNKFNCTTHAVTQSEFQLSFHHETSWLFCFFGWWEVFYIKKFTYIDCKKKTIVQLLFLKENIKNITIYPLTFPKNNT